MRKTLFTCGLFLFFLSAAFAQNPRQGAPSDSTRGRGGMMRDTAMLRNMPAIGKVIGVLKDTLSKQPLEFASVALLKVRDSSAVSGNLTDAKGAFRMEELPVGRYILRISCIGYRKMDSKPFMLTPGEPMKDFGVVYMSASIKNLKEVEVTAEKTEYVNSLDKKVYNVDKNLTSTGGTASDVLRNIPSVNVDVDGKVSLRGSENLTVLIDGKPTGLGGGDKTALLQQLPAGMIDQIEVITNPSARYDAEGMAGIINIKTHKDKRSGINGIVSAGVGTGDKYNGGITLNSRSKKVNLFTQYSFRKERREGYGSSNRDNSYTDPATIYTTSSTNHQKNQNHNLRIGADYSLNDYNTLSLNGGYNTRTEKKPENIDYVFATEADSILSAFTRRNTSTENAHGYEGSLDYRRQFAGSKKELTASANYSVNNRTSDEQYSTYAADTLSEDRLSKTDGTFSTGSAQVDFVYPISDKGKFETGAKSAMRHNDTDMKGFIGTDGSNYTAASAYTDHFIYDDIISAAYAQYSGKYKVIEYQAGLRAEQTIISGDSKTESNDFKRDYIDFFPSATLKYTLLGKNDLQLSYSRRINRPDRQALNPYTDFADSLNIRVGNPQIRPEYVNSFELGYMRKFGNQSVSGTLYYRQTENLITRYRTVDTLTGVTVTTFRNFSTAQNTGLELVVRNEFGKFLNATTSFNIYKNKVDGSNVESELQSDNTNWNVRTTLNFRFTPTTSFQVSGNYMAPNKLPQGSFKGMSGVDLGFRQDFMKGKLNLNVSVSDVLNTRKFQIHNEGTGFIMDQTRKRESRVATFTLTYRFGVADPTKSRRQRPVDQMPSDMMNPDF